MPASQSRSSSESLRKKAYARKSPDGIPHAAIREKQESCDEAQRRHEAIIACRSARRRPGGAWRSSGRSVTVEPRDDVVDDDSEEHRGGEGRHGHEIHACEPDDGEERCPQQNALALEVELGP